MWILYSMASVDDNSKLLNNQSQIVAVTDKTYLTVLHNKVNVEEMGSFPFDYILLQLAVSP